MARSTWGSLSGGGTDRLPEVLKLLKKKNIVLPPDTDDSNFLERLFVALFVLTDDGPDEDDLDEGDADRARYQPGSEPEASYSGEERPGRATTLSLAAARRKPRRRPRSELDIELDRMARSVSAPPRRGPDGGGAA